MSYTTPVTDRTQTDITTRTSKAFMNVADWLRIYGNAKLTNSLAEIMLDAAIQFDEVADPAITTISDVTDFNTLLANLERLRLAVAGESIPGTSTEIKDDYEAGPGKDAPDFTDVNLWESTVDAIWEHFDGPDLEVCPTLTADLTVTNGNIHIVVDCLDADGYGIILEGDAKLYII